MTNLRHLVALSAFLALSAYGVAQAQGVLAGDYKLAVGHSQPCAFTLAADGTTKSGTDCTSATDVTHWRPTATGLQLQDNSGATVAVLKAKDGAYEGTTFADSHEVVLTPGSQTAAN